MGGVLCRWYVICRRHSSLSNRASNSLGYLVTKALAGSALKEAKLVLKQHEQCQYHKLSTVQTTEFFTRYNDPKRDVEINKIVIVKYSRKGSVKRIFRLENVTSTDHIRVDINRCSYAFQKRPPPS